MVEYTFEEQEDIDMQTAPRPLPRPPFGLELFDCDGGKPDCPKHYQPVTMQIAVAPIDLAKYFNFCIGNAIKYICRAGKKEGNTFDSDIRKAISYLEEQVNTDIKEHNIAFVTDFEALVAFQVLVKQYPALESLMDIVQSALSVNTINVLTTVENLRKMLK